MAPVWFLGIIRKLSRDYQFYNRLLEKIIEYGQNPLKSELVPLIPEETRLSRGIRSQEDILSRWLEEGEKLIAGSEQELSRLEILRNESQKLRKEGRRSLERGLSLLEQESKIIQALPAQKNRNKEAAPRLIDITL